MLLWILGVLFGLGVLIALTRVGIRAEFGPEGPTVTAAVGLLHLRVYPGKPKPEKPKKAEPEEPPREKTGGMKLSVREIKSLITTLWPPLKKALGRTRRRVRVSPLQLSLTLAGEEDPAAAAQLCGELQAAIWTAMPVLEQLLVIREPFLHTEIDFDARETRLEGRLGLSIRIGSLLRIAMGLAVPAVSWYLEFRKNHTPKQPPEPTAAAGTAN